MCDELFAFLDEKDVEYKKDVSMRDYCSVRIGGVASVIVFPRTNEELVLLVRFLYQWRIKYKLIGKMTNILPLDEGFCGVLVSVVHLCKYVQENRVVKAECGVLFSALIMKMANIGLGGAEELFGIPGTVGGMLTSNAGAFGKEIADLLLSANIFLPSENKTLCLDKEELDFGYRTSYFKKTDAVILSAAFLFLPKETEHILYEMGKIKEKRIASQPLEYASAGSVFKRVNGVSAGYYIDKCGLKGTRIGGAAISDKHAGFIVNLGGASSQDFRELVRLAKARVYERAGVELEEEIEYLC